MKMTIICSPNPLVLFLLATVASIIHLNVHTLVYLMFLFVSYSMCLLGWLSSSAVCFIKSPHVWIFSTPDSVSPSAGRGGLPFIMQPIKTIEASVVLVCGCATTSQQLGAVTSLNETRVEVGLH